MWSVAERDVMRLEHVLLCHGEVVRKFAARTNLLTETKCGYRYKQHQQY